MSVLSDKEIAERSVTRTPMIEPFTSFQKRVNDNGQKIISYGVSSYGYDARLGLSFKIYNNVINPRSVIDPKKVGDHSFYNVNLKPYEPLVIPPNSYVLGATMERFHIPRDVLAICVGKSTYARCGLIVNVTPLEPEWEGYVTLEISNSTPLPAAVYAGEGICQFIFLKAEQTCLMSYADKAGKYQNQSEGVTLAKV